MLETLPKFSHYDTHVAGRRIVYCYIRKNACTAFKNLILHYSPERDRLEESPTQADFLRKFHAVDSLENFQAADVSIVVIRDPFDRLVSLFKNKFIQRSGHQDLFSSFRKLTGREPESACFRSFIEDYVLAYRFDRLDPHCFPQAAHLYDANYTHRILLDQVFETMSSILGTVAAEQFFKRPTNTTSVSVIDELAAARMSADALRHKYLQSRVMPRGQDFWTGPLREMVVRGFAEDFELFEEVRGRTG